MIPVWEKCQRWMLLALKQSLILLATAVLLAIVSNLLRDDKVPWVGSLRGASQPAISVDQAKLLFLSQKAVFIDARNPEAYVRGHIPGALNIPYNEFESVGEELFHDISPTAVIVTYCEGGGCKLGEKLAVLLHAKGFKNVRVLSDGLEAWSREGLPIVSSTDGFG